MANYGPSSAFLVLGGHNISGESYNLNETVESINEEKHGLGDSWEEHLPVGVARVMLEVEGGIYDDGVMSTVEALISMGQTRQLVAFGEAGSASPYGQDAVILDGAFVGTFRRVAERSGLTKAHGVFTITGDYKKGKVLHGLNAETSDPGNTEGPSVDNGASSANGATADLHVTALALGGFTSVTVKVRHSVDDITYVDLMTFTSVTVAGHNNRQTVGGTVNRHLAMSWDFIGAGAAQSITPLVIVNRG